MLTILKRSGWI